MLPADTGSNCEASCVVSCPSGWEREGDRCYFWSNDWNDWKNWFDAEETCKRHGGHLASVTDQNIHDYMRNRAGVDRWIGGFLGSQERNWLWTDCSEWDFDSVWMEGEPNHDYEKCVEYSSWDGFTGWNNDNCDKTNKFVCSKRICSGMKSFFKCPLIFCRDN